MNIKITAPSKTFLVGDYISLLGGPILVLNTEPRFQLLVTLQGQDEKSVVTDTSAFFHPDSPAGKFLTQYASDFAGYHLTFFDPHQGAGGFGASSAQFVMLYALRAEILRCAQDDSESLLTTYQNLAWSGIGPRPSGADCIGQMQGDIGYYHRAAGELTTLRWPFPEIDFCLLHTGHKINTHQHLQEISMDIIPAQDLEPLVFAAYAALNTANCVDFIAALSEYAELQKNLGLLAMTTQDLLPNILKKKGVLFAKGCGALGADVILVLLERAHSLSFAASMQRQGLRAVALGNETSEGLQL